MPQGGKLFGNKNLLQKFLKKDTAAMYLFIEN